MAHTQVASAPPQVDRCIEIIDSLKVAYGMELETVCSYLCNSINLDGIRAEEIKESLAEDIDTELGHAKRLATRLHVLCAVVPGSQELNMNQASLQPKLDLADVPATIRGVIDAEDAACKQYQHLIEICEGIDYVTQELCIELLTDEEEHRRQFQGFMKEYEKK